MARRSPDHVWTPEQDAALKQWHAEGKSMTWIRKTTGINMNAIRVRSAYFGLKWDRSQLAAATQAKAIDNAHRLSILQGLLLDDAERLRAQMWEPQACIDHGGKDYNRVDWVQPEPTPQDKLRLMQAAAAAVDRSIRIAEHDSDKGAIPARNLLSALALSLGLPSPGVEHGHGA